MVLRAKIHHGIGEIFEMSVIGHKPTNPQRQFFKYSNIMGHKVKKGNLFVYLNLNT